MFGRFGSCATVRSVWILICTLFGLIPVAYGHDLPLDRTMNALIKFEAHQADLVIRIPLDLLHEVSFPLVGDHYDIAGFWRRDSHRAASHKRSFILMGGEHSNSSP